MKFTLGTGYYRDPEFTQKYWLPNVMKYCQPLPESVVAICVGGAKFPLISVGKLSSVLLTGNLGHVGDLLNGKDREFCGWSGAVLSLAMIAYCNETDFLFLESDCLAFGPWVEKTYEDMGAGDMVFGGKMESEPFMYCAQGLFLIRHSFIPRFVSEFIQMGPDDRRNAEGKTDNLPEDKFHRLREAMSDRIKSLSFGVDRCRPIPYDSPVFYCQHLTQEELKTLHEKNLV